MIDGDDEYLCEHAGFTSFVLGHLVDGVFSAGLAFAVGPTSLWYVHCEQ
jgi:hypothetical protein